MTRLRTAAALAATLIATPVLAQTHCQTEPAAARKPTLGGLLSAAQKAGLGEALAGGLGASQYGRVATAAASAAISGDAAGVAAAIPGTRRDARTAWATGALTGMAQTMNRSAPAAQTEACQTPAEPVQASADVWR